MRLLTRFSKRAALGGLTSALALACSSGDTGAIPTTTSGTGAGGTTTKTSTTTNSGSNSASNSGSSTASGSGGAGGCAGAKPSVFPYEPNCCGYQVAIPAVAESGFDDGKGTGKPDHVHVGLAGASESTFAVNWRTPNDTTATQLLVGTTKVAVTAADTASATVQLVTGHHFLYGSTSDGANKTRAHEAHVCGLKAATEYFYKVGGAGVWSEVYALTTAPPIGSSSAIRIAVLGDSRNDPTTFAKLEEAIAAQAPDLQIFTGDAVATGSQQTQWNSWFEATTGTFKVQSLLATTPFMPVNGNHEGLAINYPAQFIMPQEVAPNEKAQGEEYYAFDYGNAHFIALNDTPTSGATGGPQLAWLEAQLKGVDRKKTPWLFVFHHQSLYSCGGSHGSNLALRSAWQPLFDTYKVDVVFSGHDHLYERSKPIRGLSGTDGKVAVSGPKGTPVNGSGTLYLISGGAGAPLYTAKTTCAHTYVTESTRNYTLVDITGTTLHVKASRLDGSVLDEFTYTK